VAFAGHASRDPAEEGTGGVVSKQPLPELPFAIGGSVWPGLSKLTEECGEVGQVIGKLMGTGGAVEHWDGSNLAQRLTEEMGDVLAAIEFVSMMNAEHIDTAKLQERRAAKLALFLRWQEEQVPLPEQVDSGQQLWVIEFRGGSYFRGLNAPDGGPAASAKRFPSKESADRYIDSSAFLAMNGAMAVPEPLLVIEFRSGSYLGHLATSVTLDKAVRYSKSDADKMASTDWVAMNGGMVVPDPKL